MKAANQTFLTTASFKSVRPILSKWVPAPGDGPASRQS